MKSKRRKKTLIIIGIIVGIVVIGIISFGAVATYRINQIPQMTFEDMLLYTTSHNEKAVVAVGVIQNGEVSYQLYGMDGTLLPQEEHIFEIGSLTKTFTAALLFEAVEEGKISLDDSIDQYLKLPEKDYYPTIRRLITHTSGYKGYYFETQMISNFLHDRNDFYGITTAQLIERIGKVDLQDRDYAFEYSNFGMAVVGEVLSEVYGENYTTIINKYIRTELHLDNTKISDGSGDLGNYWDWAENDAYMAAGALTSTMEDMLRYARRQLDGTPEYLSETHKVLAEVNAASKQNEKMNIHIDSMGASWIIDTANDIIWHNGGTGDYNCYLGFDPKEQTAVVILTNLSPGYRIPATVMGVRLLMDLREEVN